MSEHEFSSDTPEISTSGQAPVIHLSGLLRCPVVARTGEAVGRVEDVIVRLRGEDVYPPVTGLVVGVGSRQVYVSTAQIAVLTQERIELSQNTVDLRGFERRDGEVLLRTDVLAAVADAAPGPAGTRDLVGGHQTWDARPPRLPGGRRRAAHRQSRPTQPRLRPHVMDPIPWRHPSNRRGAETAAAAPEDNDDDLRAGLPAEFPGHRRGADPCPVGGLADGPYRAPGGLPHADLPPTRRSGPPTPRPTPKTTARGVSAPHLRRCAI